MRDHGLLELEFELRSADPPPLQPSVVGWLDAGHLQHGRIALGHRDDDLQLPFSRVPVRTLVIDHAHTLVAVALEGPFQAELGGARTGYRGEGPHAEGRFVEPVLVAQPPEFREFGKRPVAREERRLARAVVPHEQSDPGNTDLLRSLKATDVGQGQTGQSAHAPILPETLARPR